MRPWPKAVCPPSHGGQQGWAVRGPGLAQGVHRLSSPSPLLHPFLLSVRPSIRVSSLPVTPPSVCPPVLGPFTAPARPVPVPEPRAAAAGSAGPARGPAVPPAPPLPPGPPVPGLGQSMGRWRAQGASLGRAVWLCWGSHNKLRVPAMRGWGSTGGEQMAGAPEGPGCWLSSQVAL